MAEAPPETRVRTRGSGAEPPGGAPARKPGLSLGASSTTGVVAKVAVLAVVLAIAVWGAVPLVAAEEWVLLGGLVAVTALLFYIYLSPRRIAAKYLIPGTLFLVAFQVYPVLATLGTAFTNYSDGHRGTKDEAIEAIEGASVQQVPGSAQYLLTIAADGDAATGDLVFLLADPQSRQAFVGTADGLEELDGAQQTPDGKVTAADGYTVLSFPEATARGADLDQFSVPTDAGAIRNQGLTAAFEGRPLRSYDAGCDCVRDADTGQVWTADPDTGFFTDAQGDSLAQGWRVNVGFQNFTNVLTDDRISRAFLRILVWNLVFATGTVVLTFAFGLFMALVLNHPRIRGQRLYRSLLILPYAMPAFAMYLVWRDMFNTDFGLVNRLFGLEVNWFGSAITAQLAVLLVQLWLGYSYMFLVSTGALQAIPTDLTEAAAVDGAKPFHAFRTITFPLLLVALAPLLISSFAFNFNNFNGIWLVTEGAPFPPNDSTAGATDLLITYTYRLAFGGQGADYGLASTVSVFIFLVVGLVSVIGFRRSQALEEVN